MRSPKKKMRLKNKGQQANIETKIERKVENVLAWGVVVSPRP
jgi:hypothetical protein